MTKMAKEFKPIAKAAARQGWTVKQGRKQLKWRSPQGATVFSSISPSDIHAVDQHRRQMIKHGFNAAP